MAGKSAASRRITSHTDEYDNETTADVDEHRRYNAFICSKIDQTWVSELCCIILCDLE